MGTIEPELRRDQIPLLETRYKNEAGDQAKVRAERYRRAFAEYDSRFGAFQKDCDTRFATYRRQALASLETDERQDEQTLLGRIEQSFS